MAHKFLFSACVLTACLGVGIPSAHAQDAPLAHLLPEIILGDITLPAPGPGVLSHAAHFSPIAANDPDNPAVAIVRGFNSLMLAQLSSFPLGSSTGGLTYTFDATLGTFRRGSPSFGPAFAERALTIGKGRLSGGFNYQHASYDRFEGSALDDGSIKFYLRHEECCSVGGPDGPPTFGTIANPDGSQLTPFFEGDVIEAALSLKAKTDTVSLFANYGLTDRWDIGVAVPIVRVSLDATVVASILRLSTSSNPNIHTFVAGDPNATSETINRSDSATGIGDVVLRTKYRLVDAPGGGIAAAADFRLPTGNQDELLGSGGQTRIYFIGSAGQGRFAEHVNAGYTFSGGELPALGFAGEMGTSAPDEISYAAGLEFAASPRITILGDVIGRTLRDVGRLDMATKTFAFEQPGPVVLPPPTASFQEFEPRPGNLNLTYGAVGVKANIWGDLLLSANVLFPLTDAGLRSKVTTVFGLDFAF